MALIYIVEDDSNIQEIEEYALKNAGHSTRTFSDGASLFQEMKTALPDLIVLDIMLPDMNGNEILSQIKSDKRTKAIPVVMVTAKTAEIDAVRSFDYGADEYIRKPFSLMEYISRINRLLKEDEDDADKVLGDIRIDMKKHQAYVHEEEVALTYKEFELLLLLVKTAASSYPGKRSWKRSGAMTMRANPERWICISCHCARRSLLRNIRSARSETSGMSSNETADQ